MFISRPIGLFIKDWGVGGSRVTFTSWKEVEGKVGMLSTSNPLSWVLKSTVIANPVISFLSTVIENSVFSFLSSNYRDDIVALGLLDNDLVFVVGNA